MQTTLIINTEDEGLHIERSDVSKIEIDKTYLTVTFTRNIVSTFSKYYHLHPNALESIYRFPIGTRIEIL